MAQPKTLNERQIEVLRWISEGCPDGVMTDDAHPERISAGALARRGLVTTSGRGPTWSASVTKEGRAYLDRVDGPNPPVPRNPNVPAWQQLLEDLEAGGGRIRIENRGAKSERYRRGVVSAERAGRVPVGKRLLTSSERGKDWLDHGYLIIELADLPEGSPTAPTDFAVPDVVSRYHPVVRGFRDRKETGRVSEEQLSRASRVMQGMINEALRRSYVVRSPEHDRSRTARESNANQADFVVVIDDTATLFRLREDGVKHEGYRWRTRRTGDPTGVLRLSMLAPNTASNRRSEWFDGRAGSLESQLPLALLEAELRAAEQRERRRLEQEAEALRRVQWEAAMIRAKDRFIEHMRAEVLETQVADWTRATRIRQYALAIREQHTGVAALEWAAWAEHLADEIDPLARELSLPPPPDRLGPGDLAPFAEGWSPYMPGQRH